MPRLPRTLRPSKRAATPSRKARASAQRHSGSVPSRVRMMALRSARVNHRALAHGHGEEGEAESGPMAMSSLISDTGDGFFIPRTHHLEYRFQNDAVAIIPALLPRPWLPEGSRAGSNRSSAAPLDSCVRMLWVPPPGARRSHWSTATTSLAFPSPSPTSAPRSAQQGRENRPEGGGRPPCRRRSPRESGTATEASSRGQGRAPRETEVTGTMKAYARFCMPTKPDGSSAQSKHTTGQKLHHSLCSYRGASRVSGHCCLLSHVASTLPCL